MKLISITEHSDYLHNMNLISMSERWESHRKRVEFGKQKLKLWMFVPCKLVDGVWVVLEEPPKNVDENNVGWQIEYQEAKDRFLFEGFEYDKMGFAYLTTKKECGFDEEYMQSKTIEDLIKYDLELTETAKKQIGL